MFGRKKRIAELEAERDKLHLLLIRMCKVAGRDNLPGAVEDYLAQMIREKVMNVDAPTTRVGAQIIDLGLGG